MADPPTDGGPVPAPANAVQGEAVEPPAAARQAPATGRSILSGVFPQVLAVIAAAVGGVWAIGSMLVGQLNDAQSRVVDARAAAIERSLNALEERAKALEAEGRATSSSIGILQHSGDSKALFLDAYGRCRQTAVLERLAVDAALRSFGSVVVSRPRDGQEPRTWVVDVSSARRSEGDPVLITIHEGTAPERGLGAAARSLIVVGLRQVQRDFDVANRRILELRASRDAVQRLADQFGVRSILARLDEELSAIEQDCASDDRACAAAEDTMKHLVDLAVR